MRDKYEKMHISSLALCYHVVGALDMFAVLNPEGDSEREVGVGDGNDAWDAVFSLEVLIG